MGRPPDCDCHCPQVTPSSTPSVSQSSLSSSSSSSVISTFVDSYCSQCTGSVTPRRYQLTFNPTKCTSSNPCCFGTGEPATWPDPDGSISNYTGTFILHEIPNFCGWKTTEKAVKYIGAADSDPSKFWSNTPRFQFNILKTGTGPLWNIQPFLTVYSGAVGFADNGSGSPDCSTSYFISTANAATLTYYNTTPIVAASIDCLTSFTLPVQSFTYGGNPAAYPHRTTFGLINVPTSSSVSGFPSSVTITPSP